jgi:serine/threonine protein kinase
MAEPTSVGSLIAGRYRVIKQIGRGATGEVVLAEHPTLRTQVAIKLLSADYTADAGMRRRLKHTCAVVSKLDHPNIVSTHDYGPLEDGRYFLVMEYVPGDSLKKLYRSVAPDLLPLRRVLMILKQVCNGLTLAHDAGVIHRDIKPGNILLTRSRSGDEHAKVVDFGLAKIVEDEGKSSVTVNRKILGAPRYMAPEQLTGAPVDTRADIYSFGVVAYRLLTGEVPFEGKNPMQILAAHHQRQAAQLSLVRPASETTVPAGLEEVLMQCLATDREARPRHIGLITEAILMALPRVPDEPTEGRRSTVNRIAGGLAEAALWVERGTGEVAPPPVNDFESAEPSVIVDSQVSDGTADAQGVWQWNLISRKAQELGTLLQRHGLGNDELSEGIRAAGALEEQEVSAFTEIAILKERLDEADARQRAQAAPLRDALLSLRMAHVRLTEARASSILGPLEQQIAALEAQLAETIMRSEAEERELEQLLRGRRAELEEVQRQLELAQLAVLQHLRTAKQPGLPPEVEQAYGLLEQMLQGS